MAAEEADVDIEGDVVAAAAGWGVETGSRWDAEGRRCEESTPERPRICQGLGERKNIRWFRVFWRPGRGRAHPASHLYLSPEGGYLGLVLDSSFAFYRAAPTSPSTLHSLQQLNSFFHYLHPRISPESALLPPPDYNSNKGGLWTGPEFRDPCFITCKPCDLGRVVSFLLATGFLFHIGIVVKNFLRGSLT